MAARQSLRHLDEICDDQRAENQRPVRDRLVPGHADLARKGAAGALPAAINFGYSIFFCCWPIMKRSKVNSEKISIIGST